MDVKKMRAVSNFLELSKKLQSLKESEQYNIFKVLQNETDEVRLHSRVLTDLLNPKGRHNLVNSVAMKYFLKNCLDIKYSEGIDNNSFMVLKEHKCIDIFISYMESGVKKAIVIENKIYANDQPEQLKRYYDTAKRDGYQDVTLVYLTLDGKEASEDSIGKLNADVKESIKKISYKVEIANLINHLIEKSAQKPALRESLIQYSKIIKDLCHMSSDDKYIETLAETLKNHGDFSIVNELRQAYDQIVCKVHADFLCSIAAEINAKESRLIPDEDYSYEVVLSNVIQAYGNGWVGVSFNIPGFNNCFIRVLSEGGALFWGVSNDPSLYDDNIRSLINANAPGFKSNKGWPCYKWIEFDGFWDFRNLSSEQLDKLLYDSYRNRFVDHIITDIFCFYDELKKVGVD